MKKYLKCIDASEPASRKHFKYWIVENEIYTLRRTGGSLTGEVGVYLEEIKNPPVFIPEFAGNVEPSFNLKKRFIWVDEYGIEIKNIEKEEISI